MASVILDIIVGCLVTGGGGGGGSCLAFRSQPTETLVRKPYRNLNVIDLLSLARIVVHARPSPHVLLENGVFCSSVVHKPRDNWRQHRKIS